MVLARPSKRPRHDVWCAGIVLHASSLLLSRPPAHGRARRNVPSGRVRERGKERTTAKAAGKAKSADGFICLCVSVLRGRDTGGYTRCSPCTSGRRELAARRLAGRITTHSCGRESIFSSIPRRIVPLAGVQEWTGARSMRWSRGREGPAAFFPMGRNQKQIPNN